MSNKVCVSNLSWAVTDEDLRAAFDEFGEILDVIVMRDRDTGRSLGVGFVTFALAQEADDAINGMNEQELQGRRIKVEMAD